ncbi:MAG: hypothetical protein ACLGHC_01845 [Alphaproteobacteria bacterium]
MTAFLLDDIRNGNAAADRLLTHLAAGGDLTAQRDLLTLLIGDPAYPDRDRQLHERTFDEMVRAELLARFCALRGNNLDSRRLAAVLIRMAEATACADDRMAFAIEATGLLRRLADEGDGVASDYLASVVAAFPEVRPGLAIADAATLPTPPLIVQTSITCEQSLGDILAEAFAQLPQAEPRSIIQRVRDYLTDLVWRIRFRLSAR